jgi:UDP-N-acetylglucosamine 2-epimerase (non-hydrolysing)
MIHVIIGTKAQLIKMAPILKTLKMEGIDYNYISTGQHKATIDDILANFAIKKPDYVLYDGKDITSVFQMLIWGIKNLFKTVLHKKVIFKNDKKGIVLVHGDTFSTLLGAVMGKIGGLKVAHVESGLRSFNLFHPFPEEITRLLTFRLSDYMFCPGEWAQNNLVKYNGIKINTQLNTLYDSLRFALPAIENLTGVEIPNKPYGVVTLHRFENLYNYEAVNRIVSIVESISQQHFLVFILHKPTEIKLKKFKFYAALDNNPNIELRERYDYFKFIKLILEADFVISDGGSNQEECYFLGKPILLLRKATERHEGLSENCVLSRYDPIVIDEFINHIGSYQHELKQLSFSPSKIIVDKCKTFI